MQHFINHSLIIYGMVNRMDGL